MLLQQRRLSNVKDPDSALVKATGQLVAVWVIAAALDDLPRCCQLKQLCMSGGIPTTNCSIRGHCTVLAPAGSAQPTWHFELMMIGLLYMTNLHDRQLVLHPAMTKALPHENDTLRHCNLAWPGDSAQAAADALRDSHVPVL